MEANGEPVSKDSDHLDGQHHDCSPVDSGPRKLGKSDSDYKSSDSVSTNGSTLMKARKKNKNSPFRTNNSITALPQQDSSLMDSVSVLRFFLWLELNRNPKVPSQ